MKQCQRGFVSNTTSTTTILKILPWLSFKSDFFLNFFFLADTESMIRYMLPTGTGFHGLLNRQGRKYLKSRMCSSFSQNWRQSS